MTAHRPATVAAARELAKRFADACNVNADDVWKLHAEEFTQDAAAALVAASLPNLLGSLEEALLQWNVQFEGEQDNDPWCVAARAVITKVRGTK